MGKINILKAGYNGKLGQTYGTEEKGFFSVKAVPFSHTPHNSKQTQAKNEFIGLNRIASKVVKKMWQYFQLSDKNCYKNNALCKHWKKALKGGKFSLENLKEVISEDEKLKIDTVLFDYSNYKFSYSAKDENGNETTQKQIIYLAIVTNEQITKADITGQGNNVILSSVFNYIDFAYFQVWAFKAVPAGKKYAIKGLSITDPVFIIIVNGVFYISRWKWTSQPYIKNEILYLSKDDCKIQNNTLFLGK